MYDLLRNLVETQPYCSGVVVLNNETSDKIATT
jgi:hypothetical protein